MQHARFYSFVGGTLAGVVLTSSCTHNWYAAVFLCLGFVVASAILFIVIQRQKKSFSKNSEKKSTKNFARNPTRNLVENSALAALLVACVFGASLGAARTTLWMSFNHSGVLDNLLNKKVSLNAIVTEEPQQSDTSSKIIAEILPNVASSTSRAKGVKILIIADRYSTIEYGDEIKLYGKFLAPKPIESPGGDFAYDVYLARQGIFYTMTFPNIKVAAHHRGNIVREYLINIKNNFLGKVNELFQSPQSGLLAGLLVSGRSALSKFEQMQFTRAGLIHIVALSGFNVTIIAQGLMWFLAFLPKRLRLVIGATGIVAFVIMTGFGATIVRAGIMALLVIAAALVYRTYHVGRALFMAVLCMVLWNPMVTYDVSFQLSCIATFAVIFAAPPVIQKYDARLKFLPNKFKIREMVLGTAVIEIFLLPILLSSSGQISLVTVITNLLILPTLPVVMGFGFVATMIGYIHSALALPLVALSNLMLEYILLITKFFANIPFGVVVYRVPEWAVGAIYLVLIFWLYCLQKFSMQKNSTQKNSAQASLPQTINTPLTSANLERLDSFFRSRSNSDSQKMP